MKTYPFKMLALGVRFRYKPGYQVWVKIDHNLVAKWDSELVASGWVSQNVCSAIEGDPAELLVYLAE